MDAQDLRNALKNEFNIELSESYDEMKYIYFVCKVKDKEININLSDVSKGLDIYIDSITYKYVYQYVKEIIVPKLKMEML